MINESGKLAHRDAQNFGRTGNVPSAGDDDVKRFSEECGVVGVLRVHRKSCALAA